MAVWKQIVLIAILVAVGVVGWGAYDPTARDRLLALGAPAAALPAWAFLATEQPAAAAGPAAAGRPGAPGGSGPRSGPPSGGRGGFGGPILVVTAAAETSTTDDRITAIGPAEAARTVTVFPRSTGMVSEIRFRPGETVEAGAVLVQLDDDLERIALERAELTLDDARAKVERYEALSSSSAISAVDRNAARSELAKAELAVREARLDLERRAVRAPIAGMIGLTDVETGDMIAAQTEIATIDDRSMLTVEFRIPESAAAKVGLGQTITATTPSRPGESFEGEVSAIGSRIEVDSRTLVVQAQLDNQEDTLRPGMSFLVTLRFPGDEKTAVPALSLQWDRDGSFVWRIVEGKAERVTVAVIERNADTVLVEGDLGVGDQVVVEGVQRLRPGADVATAAAAGDAEGAAPASGTVAPNPRG